MPTLTSTDDDAVASPACDQRPGFAEFYAATFPDLAGYAGHLVGDAGLGDDLAQEALVRVCARYPVLRQPRPYAYRVATNLARDRWRAAARERRAWPLLAGPTSTPGPDGGLLDAVAVLPPGPRDAVLLHYYADLPVAEVARALRRPEGTVKRHLAEARTALARALEEPR